MRVKDVWVYYQMSKIKSIQSYGTIINFYKRMKTRMLHVMFLIIYFWRDNFTLKTPIPLI